MPLNFLQPIKPDSSIRFGGYRMKQFIVPMSRVGTGNFLADQINQFLALNQNMTVIGVTSNWRETVGRAESLLYTLNYREGGTRHYAATFQSTANTSAEDLATEFFAFNPAFRPMYTTIVSPPNDTITDKRLLVIYLSMNDFARLCLMDASPGAPYGDIVVGEFGDMQDPINANRADVLAINLGNAVWPDGGVNLIFNNVDACPDASAPCCFGGISPCCESAAPIAANALPTIIEICAGCYPNDLLTFTNNTSSTTPGDTTTTFPTQTTVSTTVPATTAPFPTTAPTTTQPVAPTTSPAPLAWILQSTPATSFGFSDVAFGDGLFVAVSASTGDATKQVMTSPDGETWTLRTSANANCSWAGVVYSSSLGLFIAVGQDSDDTRDVVMTSPDGITWTGRTSPSTGGGGTREQGWRSIAWNGTVLVATGTDSSGNSNCVITSVDGITWVLRTGGASGNQWFGVGTDGSTFVAVDIAGTGDQIMTSPDGITWTTRVNPVDASWRSVTSNGTIWVAVALSSPPGNIMTSTDGITWTTNSTPAVTQLNDVTYGNGLFVGVARFGAIGDKTVTSPDGLVWSSLAAASTAQWSGVTNNGTRHVAVAITNAANCAMTLDP